MMDYGTVIKQLADQPPLEMSWGKLVWLVSGQAMPGAEQTFGVVTINPGQRNPLHAHPNCEELLYVIAGECEHKLGDEIYTLTPGSLIRIPRGVPHWARCTSAEPLVAVISFSSPDRRADDLEGGALA
jgi:quercetin dioxygenase-like cupin family protein